jgi:Polyketide cyclase / dehydrase and lipid transport
MPRILLSGVVDALAERAWGIIRRFDAGADWLPFVKSSPIEDRGDPTRVGCVRVVTQKDGAVFREVLAALSDAESSYPCTFVGSHEFLPANFSLYLAGARALIGFRKLPGTRLSSSRTEPAALPSASSSGDRNGLKRLLSIAFMKAS